MSRRPVIAGNWKMHMTPQEVRAFFQDFSPAFPGETAPTLLVFPPFVSLAAAMEARPSTPQVEVGVQNIYWEAGGAFTGEVSAPMARAAGATYTLIGHSERRHIFGETNEEVGWKVQAALDADLVPVVCVGETLSERQAGQVAAVILEQLEAILPVIAEHPGMDFLLAYEPVWAIGTGETATPQDASEAHQILRVRLTEALGPERGGSVAILYGGSVKPGNAAELLAASEVDGVLVGGASLDPASFSRIAEAG
jgi:triosephosphate isomerase